jgi:hypothetical protein
LPAGKSATRCGFQLHFAEVGFQAFGHGLATAEVVRSGGPLRLHKRPGELERPISPAPHCHRGCAPVSRDAPSLTSQKLLEPRRRRARARGQAERERSYSRYLQHAVKRHLSAFELRADRHTDSSVPIAGTGHCSPAAGQCAPEQPLSSNPLGGRRGSRCSSSCQATRILPRASARARARARGG